MSGKPVDPAAPKRKRGRPTLAAQSLDAALAAVYEGTAPRRPRNQFERDAALKRRPGRPPNPNAGTRVAAEAVRYRVEQGEPLSAALRSQCLELLRARGDINEDEVARKLVGTMANVRRYLKKLAPKTVACPYRGAGWIAVPPAELPLVHSVEDVGPSE
jgi:hypothetical protein